MKTSLLAGAPLALVLLVAVGCDDDKVGGPCPGGSDIDILRAVCKGSVRCEDMYSGERNSFGDFSMGIRDCGSGDGALLYGGWVAGHEGAQIFEWTATIPTAGVFPSNGTLSVPVECIPGRACYPHAETTIATDIPGFDAIRPIMDDVFIPLHGSAVIDRSFHATATLDELADGAPRRASIVAEQPTGSLVVDAGVGDSFVWGRYWATVVRVVEPRTGLLQPIGWIEVKLTDLKPEAAQKPPKREKHG